LFILYFVSHYLSIKLDRATHKKINSIFVNVAQQKAVSIIGIMLRTMPMRAGDGTSTA